MLSKLPFKKGKTKLTLCHLDFFFVQDMNVKPKILNTPGDTCTYMYTIYI